MKAAPRLAALTLSSSYLRVFRRQNRSTFTRECTERKASQVADDREEEGRGTRCLPPCSFCEHPLSLSLSLPHPVLRMAITVESLHASASSWLTGGSPGEMRDAFEPEPQGEVRPSRCCCQWWYYQYYYSQWKQASVLLEDVR